MVQRPNSAETWLVKNQNRMISCPYQPGNLFISRNACLKRYRNGDRQTLRNPLYDDTLAYQWKMGISVCRKCPIGRSLISEPSCEENPEKSQRT